MIISNIPVPSDQHISSVDSVHEHEPSKHFMFENTFGLPNVGDEFWWVFLLETEPIEIFGFEASVTLTGDPFIMSPTLNSYLR